MLFEARNELGYQHIRLQGELSRQSLVEAYETMIASPSYDSALNCLWDFSEASLRSLGPSDIAMMGRFAQDNAPDVAGKRRAVLVAADVDYGLSRMFQAMNDEGLPGEFQVFRSLDEATGWLTKADRQTVV